MSSRRDFMKAVASVPIASAFLDGKDSGYLVKVNCAGPAADGFSADQPYTPGSWGYTHGGQYFMCDSPVSNDYGIPTAIKTCRYSCGAPFHYKFDVPNGYYRIRMYFVNPIELYGLRTFDVILNRHAVLSQFRPFPLMTGLLKQFDDTPVTDGQIDITFRSINDACTISAIEVEQTSATAPPKPTPKPRLAPGTLPRTDHDDLIISYYGRWTTDGKAHYSNIPGNALDFTFKGPIIRWIGSRNSNHGIAEIYLDGVCRRPWIPMLPSPRLTRCSMTNPACPRTSTTPSGYW